MIRSLLAWLRRDPETAPETRCLVCEAHIQTIEALRAEVRFGREQVSALYQHLGAPTPAVPEPEPPLPPARGVETKQRMARRLAPWSQSLAADGHVDIAMQDRHRNLARGTAAASDAQYDEGFTSEARS